MDFHKCPCTGGTLARLLRPAIMSVLAGEPAHGYLVAEKLGGLKLFAELPPDRAGVYRALHDMEERGLVESDWELTDTGPARRSFHLTEAGTACMEHWVQTLREYRKGVSDLLDSLLQIVHEEENA